MPLLRHVNLFSLINLMPDTPPDSTPDEFLSNVVSYLQHLAQKDGALHPENPDEEFIDILCELGKLTLNHTDTPLLLKRGKEFLAMPPTLQQLSLFQSYWDLLDWNYLFEEDNPQVTHLQDNRLNVLVLLYELQGAIETSEFCTFLGQKLGFDNPVTSHRIIIDTCLDPMVLFGIAEYVDDPTNPLEKRIGLTEMGRQSTQLICQQSGVSLE